MEFLILVFLGLFVGFLSSFFGIGGGSLIVPVLYALHPDLSSENIISISLSTICLNSAINCYHYKKVKIFAHNKIILIFAITALIGSTLGHQILRFLDTETNKKVFATILLIVAVKSLVINHKSFTQEQKKESSFIIAVIGFIGSFFSSITGLGGGVIFNPMLMFFAKVPIKYISAYSNVGMFFASLLGVIPFFLSNTTVNIDLGNEFLTNSFIGKVNFGFITVLSASTLLSSKIGVIYNQRVNSKVKRYLLTTLLLILSIKILAY